jgi:A/G-specific adenine glycosylase
MAPALPADARAAVLAWYDAGGRALAFRSSRDPYAILVSEVMAQQTQVSRVVEAWPRFLARFPTVNALAAATPAEVVRAWQGMGYDRRALNLRLAAQVIRDEHGGRVPDDVEALDRLPGVGPYTARAVAAIAFGRRVGAVDTNVRRVVSRSLAGGRAAEQPATWVQEAADESVDPGRPADWTHALMDVGATVCRPRRPRCDACPVRPWCRWVAEASEGANLGAGAAADGRPTATRHRRASPEPAFASTNRWLRGRIVDRLRAADDGAWVAVADPIGEHDANAVDRALRALARDGLVELDAADARRARLATA